MKKVVQKHVSAAVIMLIALAMLAGICFATPAQAASAKSKAMKAYEKILKGYPSDALFAVFYADSDSIPELVAFEPDNYLSTRLYTYKNNRTYRYKGVNDFYPSMYYRKKGVLIWVDDAANIYIKMNTSRKTLSKVLSRADWNYNGRYSYYTGDIGKKISRATFNSRLRKMVGSTKARFINYVNNTARNRKKYLR